MLSELINITVLDQFLSYFTETTSLNVRLVDMEGKLITYPRKFSQQCKFCSLVQSTSAGETRCRAMMKNAIQEAIRWGGPYYYICDFGLMEWVVPLVVSDEELGALFCGQILNNELDDFSYTQIIKLASQYGLSSEVINQSLSSIAVLSVKKVKAEAELLYLIATHLIKLGYESLEQRRKITEQQMRLAEEIALRKQQGIPLGYSRSIEKELIHKVRLGDLIGAKEILNTILGSILFQDEARPELVKARIIELVGMLSRVAVEAGARLEEILGTEYADLAELAKMDEQDQISFWLIKLLDRFSAQVYEKRNIEKIKVISEALDYIRKKSTTPLTLSEVANRVHRSPFYLSHLFKEQLDTTFSDYLNLARIEKAKQLMQNHELSLAEIAQSVGFTDQSYFGRIFKREEGITPAKYRKKVV
ncbi:MAG: PocR ligand-binding domain-containing protein [bacterium]